MKIPKVGDFYYEHHEECTDVILERYRDAILDAIINHINDLDYEPARWQLIEMLDNQKIN